MEKSPIHHTASLRASLFCQLMEKKTKSLDAQLNEIVDKAKFASYKTCF
jgi:hypothetical protein